MELNIKNKTVYNKELIIKYNKFFSRGYIRKNFIIMSFIAIGFMAYMIYNKEYLLAGGIVVLIIGYFILTLILQKLTIKRMLLKSPLVDNPVTQTYHFKQDRILVNNSQKQFEVSYDDIVSAKRGNDFYLLKTNQNKSFIIDFSGFDSEEDKKQLHKYFVIRYNMKE